MRFRPVLLPSHFFFFFPRLPSAGLIEILLVCLCGMRDENDFVDRKKDDDRGEVEDGALFKKMAEDGKSMRDEKYQNS